MRKDRPTLFDSLTPAGSRNIFCTLSDLDNEATVEQRLVLRLLSDLGYKDQDIQPKDSIQPVSISLGRKKIPYRPDFQILFKQRVAWVLDAKGAEEPLDEWTAQCASYCFEINKDREEIERAKYFMLTNGLLTRVYPWDSRTPIIELKFSDFQYGNPLYEELRAILSKASFDQRQSIRNVGKQFEFTKPSMQEVRKLFLDCHTKIWKMDKRSPASAFTEFVKLMFLKLWQDRSLRDNPETSCLLEADLPLPPEAVTFSVRWIEDRERDTDNPVDVLLFNNLREAIEEEIQVKKKKRIFEPDEHISKRQTRPTL